MKKSLKEIQMLDKNQYEILNDFIQFVAQGNIIEQARDGNGCIINYKQCSRKAQRLIWAWVRRQSWRHCVLGIVFD